MSATETRYPNTRLRRLQLLLMLMILWDLLALAVEISFGGPLAEVDGDEVGGFLAARAGFSGAVLVPIVVYLYGLARNPLRHRGVVWVGIVEQAAAAAFAAYHYLADDIKLEGAVAPILVSAVLLVLLLMNMPRARGQVGA